ncbi:MAG: hypothetical protein LUD19_02990 [Clostridia bacterium]|nr:hypothetical protein [Clostridia bacterium]
MDDFKTFDWNDEIDPWDMEDRYEPLPEGDYNFTVKEYERAWHNGSAKVPACNKAIVTFTIHGESKDMTVKESFFLCSAFGWKLKALFESVGLLKHGEKLRMQWDKLEGKTGKCHLYVDTYTDMNGVKRENNKIKKFYSYDDEVEVSAPESKTVGGVW